MLTLERRIREENAGVPEEIIDESVRQVLDVLDEIEEEAFYDERMES